MGLWLKIAKGILVKTFEGYFSSFENSPIPVKVTETGESDDGYGEWRNTRYPKRRVFQLYNSCGLSLRN